MSCDCDKGVRLASDKGIIQRRTCCKRCPHATKSADPAFAHALGLTTKSECLLCRCNISQMTKVASAECPDAPPRWLSEGI